MDDFEKAIKTVMPAIATTYLVITIIDALCMWHGEQIEHNYWRDLFSIRPIPVQKESAPISRMSVDPIERNSKKEARLISTTRMAKNMKDLKSRNENREDETGSAPSDFKDQTTQPVVTPTKNLPNGAERSKKKKKPEEPENTATEMEEEKAPLPPKNFHELELERQDRLLSKSEQDECEDAAEKQP